VEEKRIELIVEHEPIRIEPPVVDIPKSVRVQKEKQAPLFQTCRIRRCRRSSC